MFRVSTENSDCSTAVTPGNGELVGVTLIVVIRFINSTFQPMSVIPSPSVQFIVVDSSTAMIIGPLGCRVTVSLIQNS